MANHFHVVIATHEDCSGAEIARDLKSYASRALSKTFGKPKSDTWWTSQASKRLLQDEEAVRLAVEYVVAQEFPLIVWRSETGG